jgi:radical SAM superfamily enzyme YgiQ (UPF0313 family)
MNPPGKQSVGAQPMRRRLRIVVPASPAVNVYSAVARRTTALGPVCVATSAREVPGWEVEVVDESNYGRGGPCDESGRPDHVALQRARPADVMGFYGGLTSTIPRLYELAKLYKDLGGTTVAGGQHFVDATIAEALHSGVDFVVVGEGEQPMAQLLAHLDGRTQREDVCGVAYLDGGEVVRTEPVRPLECFDGLPDPDFSLVRYANLKLYPVSRVRGCGMNCEFCTVKGRPRYASPERLLEQVGRLYETHGATHFFIVDDLFGQDRAETLRLCRMLRDYQWRVRKRFSLTVQIRLDKGRDEELLGAMRDAGVTTVAIGYESPIPAELRAMNKRLDPGEMVALTRRFRRAGFSVHGMFIFGYPMQEGSEFRMGARERVRHFRSFIRRARLDTVQVLLPVPLPGTELTRRLEREGRIFARDLVGWEYYDGNFPLFEPDPPLTAQEMQMSIRKIMGRFYRQRYMLSVALHTVSFPALVFHLHNLRSGWRRWNRRWWSSVFRVAGSAFVRRWTAQVKSGGFARKLAQAQAALHAAVAPPPVAHDV